MVRAAAVVITVVAALAAVACADDGVRDNTQLERVGLDESDLTCSADDPCELFIDDRCGGCGDAFDRAFAVAVPASVAARLSSTRSASLVCISDIPVDDPSCAARDAICDKGICRLQLARYYYR